MPIYHDVPQYSVAWDNLRIGIPTSSGFEKIITPTGKESAQWKKYAHALIAERVLNRRLESFMSPWMERGKELEEDAMSQYELMRDIETKEIGFVTTDDGKIGCSPDRLVGEDGLLELKVPAPQTQIDYILGEELVKAYYPQLQGQLFVTERKWVDIMAYHPEIPPVITRLHRDEGYIECMQLYLAKVTSYIDEKMAYIETLGGNNAKKI